MTETTPEPLSEGNLSETARAFREYCVAERERRRNSGEEFDEAIFDEAIELVLRRLHTLEEEGVV